MSLDLLTLPRGATSQLYVMATYGCLANGNFH